MDAAAAAGVVDATEDAPAVGTRGRPNANPPANGSRLPKTLAGAAAAACDVDAVENAAAAVVFGWANEIPPATRFPKGLVGAAAAAAEVAVVAAALALAEAVPPSRDGSARGLENTSVGLWLPPAEGE